MGDLPDKHTPLRALLKSADGSDPLLIPQVQWLIHTGRLSPLRSDMCPEVFADEDHVWIAKSCRLGTRKVCAEFVTAMLARRLGVFTPAFGALRCDGHAWFASCQIERQLALAEHEAWDATSGSPDFSRLFVFDWLIENRDRGNYQNTLVAEIDGVHRLVTIDHSHSGVAAYKSPAGRGILPTSTDFGEPDKEFWRRAAQHPGVIDQMCEDAAALSRGVYMRIVEMAHGAVGEDVFGGLGEVLHQRATGMKRAIHSVFGR